jgi:hypothetical protein
MIEYKQIEDSEIPHDVELITDDSQAEMLSLESLIKETEFEISLPEGRDESDGKFHIKIPGDLAGDFSECVWDLDNGKLERLTEQWNRAVLDSLDSDSKG